MSRPPLFTALFYVTCSALIIPEELPSILQLIYSKIPPIKKGTDSRFGIGFRLGPHADFQVHFEVGPQTNTNPIGPDGLPPGKRETLQMENTQTLVNMVNHWKMPKAVSTEDETETDDKVISDTPGGGWLDSWRTAFKAENSYFGKIKFKKVPGIDNRRDLLFVPAQEYYVDHLRKLYRVGAENT